MPLYEYRCADCDRRFEVLQRMGDGADGLVCPSCGNTRLTKVHSTFAASVGGGGDVAGEGCACAAAGDAPMSGCCRLPA